MSAPQSYNTAVLVAASPPNQGSGYTTYSKNLLVTGILHMICAGILIVLGLVAIPLRTVWAYFSISIGTGLFFIGITGFLGLLAGLKGKRRLVRAYTGMSVFAALGGFGLVAVYSVAAVYETCRWECYDECRPAGYSMHCTASEAVRKAVDSLVVITASFEAVLAIVSFSFGCSYSCPCCAPCCKKCGNCCTPPPPPTTATFVNNTAGPATISVQGVPQGGNYNVQGGPPNANQSTVYIVQRASGNDYSPGPGTSAAYPQPQVNAAYVPGPSAAEIPKKE